MAEPDFRELNRAIQEAGAAWEAGPTSMSRYFGEKVGQEHFGLAFDPEAAGRELAESSANEASRFRLTSPPPPRLDWRQHQGGNYVTSVRDQGSCGSCVAFATVGCLEARVLIELQKPGGQLDLSEAHLFYCGTSNACGVGWDFAPALTFAKKPGVGLEKDFAYIPGNQACRPTQPAVRVDGYRTATSLTARKLAVARGPVIAGMRVFDDFMTYRGGVYRQVTGNFLGWHAVLVIGYDDDRRFWIAKNSWSPRWGEQGFFRIEYGQCDLDSGVVFYDPDVSLIAQNLVT